ncbi:HEAT repeat domain-containing protein [Neobacillus mesonae]|uniref:HEAT repeat domain-containing protein n=1 Tax=Neobacillus mesonae TaxID=1193713 RepID=UPI002E213D69|nr:HEAT repeat domain-containing protein [Neobacillus mesonae]
MIDIEQLKRDVNQEGYRIETYQDLKKLKSKDKNLIPILLKYLKSAEKNNEKEFFVRCLGVRGFTEATETLIEEFLTSENRALKWAIGNTLSIILDKSREDDYIDIIKDKQHGTTRQMFAVTLGKLKCEKAIPKLITLLNDEEINGHVIMALGYFNNYELVEKVKPFLEHDEKWIRREAEKSIKKLEKFKE